MKIKTNYSSSNKSENPFDLIAPGIYDAKVFGTDYSEASTGTPCLNVEFEILGPANEGRHIWSNIYLTEKAGWKYASLCAAVGITPGEELDLRELLNKRLRIVVKEVQSSDGGLRSEAVGFRKPRSVPIPN
jgi:hypothetical protein